MKIFLDTFFTGGAEGLETLVGSSITIIYQITILLLTQIAMTDGTRFDAVTDGFLQKPGSIFSLVRLKTGIVEKHPVAIFAPLRLLGSGSIFFATKTFTLITGFLLHTCFLVFAGHFLLHF